MQDDPRSKHPKNARTGANVDKVRTLMRSERKLGVRLLVEEGYGNLFGEKTQTLA
jgi:hypothetical protein